MNCELEVTFAELANEVSATQDDMTFSAQVFPEVNEQMMTDHLIVQHRIHQYNNCFRADALWFQATKKTYQHLGLLVLSVIFREDAPSVTIELTHPKSDIKYITVECNPQMQNEIYSGYSVRPNTFRYQFEELTKHFWREDTYNLRDLPCFWLTKWNSPMITDEDWESRNTIVGFGSDIGSIRLAELLLNISNTQSLANEYSLEGPWGFQRVGRFSAEVRFFLPGSLGWDSEL